jgi:hypothetical protein
MTEKKETDPTRIWTQGIISILDTYRRLASSVADHAGTIGESREFFVREILSRFLPKSVRVGTGQIVDSNNQLSKQIDVVISRPEFPVLTSMALSDVFFVESVIATIEVKSKLDKKTLWEALDNSRSVKRHRLLEREDGENSFRDLMRRFKQLPATYIFGYTGYRNRLSDLKKAICDWIETEDASLAELPNVIVTQGCVVMTNLRGAVTFNSGMLRRSLGHDCIFVARRDKEALTWLLAHLLGSIGGIYSGGPYAHLRYVWGVDYANEAFFENSWDTWGKWTYDDGEEREHLYLNAEFDGTYDSLEETENNPMGTTVES